MSGLVYQSTFETQVFIERTSSYFKPTKFERTRRSIQVAAAADIRGNVPEETRKAVMSRFTFGPVVEHGYWNKECATMRLDRGPYLHPGNLFISNGRISCMLDWQGIWAAPLLLRARHPRLVDYQGDIILKPPANFNNLDAEEKKIIREKMSKSIVIYLYGKQIAKEVPLLNRVLHLCHGRSRCDPIQFVGNTWDDDILPLRESLIQLERYWRELGFDFPCPIHFTEEELRTHVEESEGWNDVQEFWNSVANIVTREGWTPNHLYNDAVTLFAELRDTGLKTMTGKEREDFKKQTQWVEKA
ncbi:hypothetical protein BDW75DRAFT_232219 [Aspergillus navahoensis]